MSDGLMKHVAKTVTIYTAGVVFATVAFLNGCRSIFKASTPLEGRTTVTNQPGTQQNKIALEADAFEKQTRTIHNQFELQKRLANIETNFYNQVQGTMPCYPVNESMPVIALVSTLEMNLDLTGGNISAADRAKQGQAIAYLASEFKGLQILFRPATREFLVAPTGR